MKTNLPDGISQQNRTHPYFIMLRNQNDRQQELIRRTVHSFLTNLLATCGVVLIGALVILLLSGSLTTKTIEPYRFLLATVAVGIVMVYNFVIRYRTMTSIIAQNINGRVNQMLYSNEFQSAILNHEEVLNLMMSCNDINGQLNQFRRSYAVNSVTVVMAALMILTFSVL